MARFRSFLTGRWGFVLSLAALALVGGGYFLRVQVRDQGLKSFDHKGDLVLVVSPQDHSWLDRRMVEIAWNNARRHPALSDIRFIIYVDRKTVLDQFGRPPQMDIYLGNVYLPPAQVEALRRTPALEEAHSRWPIMYLDWEWTYQRRIVHLAADEVAAPAIPRGRDWAASLNWVLFNMLPPDESDFRWTTRFREGWSKDPHLVRADPDLTAQSQGPLGASPAQPRGEMAYSFTFARPWKAAWVRDIHTAWQPTESVTLRASVDGQTWKQVYAEQGYNRRNLAAVRLTPEMAGGGPGAQRIFLRYTMEIKLPSTRSADDRRGADLSFVDLAVSYAK